MDKRQLRDSLGLFATGVIIACARKKNFFTEGYFSEKFSAEKIKKFEDSWNSFFSENKNWPKA